MEEDDPRDLVVRRELDAPRELVFQAWTRPEHLAQWFGPKGFTITTHEMDFAVGGVWRFVMHGPDGIDYPNRVRYTEIVEPERIVYLHDAGEGDPNGFRNIATFEDRGGKTLLTMRARFSSAEELERHVREYGAVEGANQTMDRLAAFLQGGRK